MTMHKKMDVLIIFIMVNLLISFMFYLLPFFLPSFLQLQQHLATFMCHGFLFLQLENLFSFSFLKTHWIMITDIVNL